MRLLEVLREGGLLCGVRYGVGGRLLRGREGALLVRRGGRELRVRRAGVRMLIGHGRRRLLFGGEGVLGVLRHGLVGLRGHCGRAVGLGQPVGLGEPVRDEGVDGLGDLLGLL